MSDNVNIQSPVIYFRVILNIGNMVYNLMSMEKLALNHLGRAREDFHDDVIFHHRLRFLRIGDAFSKGVLTILTRSTLKWL